MYVGDSEEVILWCWLKSLYFYKGLGLQLAYQLTLLMELLYSLAVVRLLAHSKITSLPPLDDFYFVQVLYSHELSGVTSVLLTVYKADHFMGTFLDTDICVF